jgi:hypothetical protein
LLRVQTEILREELRDLQLRENNSPKETHGMRCRGKSNAHATHKRQGPDKIEPG